jgi:hypothetical protein
VLLMALLPAGAAGQSVGVAGTLAGRVIEAGTGAALASAEILLFPAGEAAPPAGSPSEAVLAAALARDQTGPTGSYALERVPPGRYWIHVRRIGYRPATVEVRVVGPSSPHVSVALDVEPITLEPLEVVTRADAELRDVTGARLALGRVDAARIRQTRYLTSDSRLVTPAEVEEAVTLGEADVFRALQRLPGVSTRDDFSAELWTRGASWGETRVYLDGMPLFNPLHGFGLLSGLSFRGVGAVVLHPGVHPVTFPEGGAAVLDIHTRSGLGMSRPQAGLDVSLASAQAWGSGPVSDGSGGWAATLRRSYADVVAGAVDDEKGETQFPYEFTDLQTRIDLDLGDGILLDATALWERDAVTGELPDVLHRTRALWGNAVGRAALSFPMGAYHARATLGGTRYRASIDSIPSTFDDDFNAPAEDPSSHVMSYARLGIEVVPGGRGADSAWSAGADLSRQASRYAGPEAWPYASRPAELAETRWAAALTRLGVWGRRRLSRGDLSLDGGLRVDVGSTTVAGRVELSPSLVVGYRPARGTSISAAVARSVQYAQSPAAVGPRFEQHLESGRLWILADPRRAPLSVRTGTLGAEQWIGERWLASATVYARKSTGVLLPDPTPGPLIQRTALVAGEVDAKGLDVSLRRLSGRITGWVGYSLSRADADVLGRRIPAPTDRRHTFDLTASTALGSGWELGLAHTFTTGAPYARVLDDCEECGDGVHLDAPFLRRGPSYESLDVLLSWSHTFDRWAFGFFIQGRNLLGHDNAVTYSNTVPVCGTSGYLEGAVCGDGREPERRDRFLEGIPTLPLLGLQVRF